MAGEKRRSSVSAGGSRKQTRNSSSNQQQLSSQQQQQQQQPQQMNSRQRQRQQQQHLKQNQQYTNNNIKNRQKASAADNNNNVDTSKQQQQQQQPQKSNNNNKKVTKRVEGTTYCLPIVYGSIAVVLSKEEADEYQTHQWTLFLRGPNNEDLSTVISKVVFQLHASFSQPMREILSPPYEVTERGWGEFEAQIRIMWKDPLEKPIVFTHGIKLYPPPKPTLNPSPLVTGTATASAGIANIAMNENIASAAATIKTGNASSSAATIGRGGTPTAGSAAALTAAASISATTKTNAGISTGVGGLATPATISSTSALTAGNGGSNQNKISNSTIEEEEDKDAPVIMETYDEVVFTDPTEFFFAMLNRVCQLPMVMLNDEQSQLAINKGNRTSAGLYSDENDFRLLLEAQIFLQHEITSIKERFQIVTNEIEFVDDRIKQVQEEKTKARKAQRVANIAAQQQQKTAAQQLQKQQKISQQQQLQKHKQQQHHKLQKQQALAPAVAPASAVLKVITSPASQLVTTKTKTPLAALGIPATATRTISTMPAKATTISNKVVK